MARYQYRHRLDIDNDSVFTAREKIILDAAFAVAARAHQGQSRDKTEPEWQYITHPIMVYDIMRALGERDVTVLAAALLHDAIEESSEFRANDIWMGDAFSNALSERGIKEASTTPPKRAIEEADMGGENYAVVDKVVALVRAVTNPKIYDGEGIKEPHQHDRIKEMSFAAKKIKLVDQAASLICNLSMANNPEKFTPQQEVRFTEKAHALAISIVKSVQDSPEEREAIKPFAAFFGGALLNVLPLLESQDAEQIKQVRRDFDFDRLCNSAVGAHVNILPPTIKEVRRLTLAYGGGEKKGLTWVAFDVRGRVMGYGLWVNWEDPEHAANDVQKKLTEALRSASRGKGGSESERMAVMPEGIPHVRDAGGKRLAGIDRAFSLFPPMQAADFVRAAKATWAASREQGYCIQSISKQVSATDKGYSPTAHGRS
ncbi:MAG: hypothetical protein SFW64_00375 [Alphaproteobacteria bacterium]|nr:hypothetical protein [Alphaproteobacteria bacterium]